MPTETRKIVFSSEELRKVIINYCVRKGIRLPAAAIASVALNPGSKDFATASFAKEDLEGSDGDGNISFTQDQMGAAVILYCRSRHIPLPRAGEKSLEPANGGISFVISTPRGDDPGPKAS